MRRSIIAAAAAAAFISSSALALDNLNLTFSGSGNTLAATGFETVYNLDPTHFSVGGGFLNINTQTGDTFGDFENDPDSAKNMFYNNFEARARTTVNARVRYSNLNENFHGGGIWLGTDQDHLIRLGVINAGANAVVEALREDEDYRPDDLGQFPFQDIRGRQSVSVGSTPLLTPVTIDLRLERAGSSIRAFYSTDATNFIEIEDSFPAGGNFWGLAFDPSHGGSVEGGFKVGAYAFGGGPSQIEATASFDTFSAVSTGPSVTVFTGTGEGNWDNAASWSAGVPNAIDTPATLGPVGASTITVPGSRTLGYLDINNPTGGYTLNGGTLNFDVATGRIVLNDFDGNHTINSAVVLNDDTNISVVNVYNSLTLAGQLTATGRTIDKQGVGGAGVKTLRAAALNIRDGTFSLLTSGAATVSRVNSLSLTGDATPQGSTHLDVGNNGFIIDYSGVSPFTTTEAQIKAGRAPTTGGVAQWNGPGIVSAAAQANPSTNAIGYAEASDILGASGGTFMGDTVDGTAVLFRYTRLGDANLSGKTDIQDFARLASKFGQAGSWANGDFNYDGNVNINDFAILASNFNQVAADLPRGAAVPEPTLAALALAAIAVRRRVRR